MSKVISIFNNKGGVGKTTILWNLGHALGESGKKVLLIDFDPQCNLSISILGSESFRDILPTQNRPYGTCIRAYLQRFLQGNGGEEIFLHKGELTSNNTSIVAGDFWLNVYADALSVGNDLLAGTGISRFVIHQKIIEEAEKQAGHSFDYTLIDLPPSFNNLVRSALYCSDYFLVPCTSDDYSEYCVGLIGEMLPNFIEDWEQGMKKFTQSNPHFSGYEKFGNPKFAGWIFNGFDKRNNQPVAADRIYREKIEHAVAKNLVEKTREKITTYNPIANNLEGPFECCDFEDMNVLIQNSIQKSCPVAELESIKPVRNITSQGGWASNQRNQIRELTKKFSQLANHVVSLP